MQNMFIQPHTSYLNRIQLQSFEISDYPYPLFTIISIADTFATPASLVFNSKWRKAESRELFKIQTAHLWLFRET